MDPVSALRAEEGICCFVGAGGKKTTIYTLANRLERAVVTAAVRIPIFDEHVTEVHITQDPAAAIADVDAWPIGVVPEREGDDRYRGFEPLLIDELADIDPVVLVKADGARMRRFKAPGEHEPRIPRRARTVVAIASAHVIGEPLDEGLVHRPERVADIADIAVGETVTPDVVATVLTSQDGGRKDVPPEAGFVALVNMVDDEEDLAAGRAIADAIHDRLERCRVVLAAMRESDPIVEVVDGPSRF